MKSLKSKIIAIRRKNAMKSLKPNIKLQLIQYFGHIKIVTVLKTVTFLGFIFLLHKPVDLKFKHSIYLWFIFILSLPANVHDLQQNFA